MKFINQLIEYFKPTDQWKLAAEVPKVEPPTTLDQGEVWYDPELNVLIFVDTSSPEMIQWMDLCGQYVYLGVL